MQYIEASIPYCSTSLHEKVLFLLVKVEPTAGLVAVVLGVVAVVVTGMECVSLEILASRFFYPKIENHKLTANKKS